MPQGRSSAAFLAALLVLMARPSSPAAPLRMLNPWLSACELTEPAAALPDLRGSCTPRPRVSEGPGPPCPRPCVAENTTYPQCLHYLRGDEADRRQLCANNDHVDGAAMLARLAALRLPLCCEHSLLDVLGAEQLTRLLRGGESCQLTLDAVLRLDALVAAVVCKFTQVLARYDCQQPYSVAFNCSDCQEAYRLWACGSLLPHFVDSGQARTRLRPCRSVCERVEQRCPFFLPGDRAPPPGDTAPAYPTQYAGEPAFLCLDAHIPETGEQHDRSSYGEAPCCFWHCSPVAGAAPCGGGCQPPRPPDHVHYCGGSAAASSSTTTSSTSTSTATSAPASACPPPGAAPRHRASPPALLGLALQLCHVTWTCDIAHSLLRHTVSFILVCSLLTIVWGNA